MPKVLNRVLKFCYFKQILETREDNSKDYSCSYVVSDLRSETKGSRFESDC